MIHNMKNKYKLSSRKDNENENDIKNDKLSKKNLNLKEKDNNIEKDQSKIKSKKLKSKKLENDDSKMNILVPEDKKTTFIDIDKYRNNYQNKNEVSINE